MWEFQFAIIKYRKSIVIIVASRTFAMPKPNLGQ